MDEVGAVFSLARMVDSFFNRSLTALHAGARKERSDLEQKLSSELRELFHAANPRDLWRVASTIEGLIQAECFEFEAYAKHNPQNARKQIAATIVNSARTLLESHAIYNCILLENGRAVYQVPHGHLVRFRDLAEKYSEDVHKQFIRCCMDFMKRADYDPDKILFYLKEFPLDLYSSTKIPFTEGLDIFLLAGVSIES